MAPSEERMEKGELPSIPILGCRWGLGEGVSPIVFKPIPIPAHLLRTSEQPPAELPRRLRGRGRAAGLSCHDNALPAPGELGNVGVASLSISEQLSRVQGNLPIYQSSTDYSQYILPRSSMDDEDAPEPASPAPPHQVVGPADPALCRQRAWAEALDPWGEVAAVDSALLPQTMARAEQAGDGDAGLRALQRYCKSDDSDLDVLEECTNSSDMSSEWRRPRVWRPRPPPLTEDSFPPLPGASAAPDSRSAGRAQPKSDRSPSKSDRSKSGPSPSKSDRSKSGRSPSKSDRSKSGRSPSKSDRSKSGRSPSKSDRSSSETRSAWAGGGPSPSWPVTSGAQPKSRAGRRARRSAAVTPAVTLAVTPAVTPAVTSAVTPAVTPAVTLAVTPAVTPVVTSAVTPAVTSAVTPAETAAAAGQLTAAPAAEDASDGEVHVTGVTDVNWKELLSLFEMFGTVTDHRRGQDGDGWITLSPPDSAEWLLSVQRVDPCHITGVEFRLAKGGEPGA